MGLQAIDANLYRRMIVTAASALREEKDAVNALNVFPVPDGDTGSNMSLTLAAAVAQIEKAGERTDLGALAKAVSLGSVMGARGNSGVILSQLFSGFARSADGASDLDAVSLARAFEEGVDTAYKAVMKPVEGTILTVAKESARSAARVARTTHDVARTLVAAHEAACTALERTPDLLPVLKKAGVVDAGGKGYCVILAGYLQALGLSVAAAAQQPAPGEAPAAAPPAARDTSPSTHVDFRIDEEISNIRYPYDCEFFIRGNDIPMAAVRATLENGMGDSVLVVGGPDVVKVHIHTDNPGPVLDCCVRLGDLTDIAILNMRRQHADLVARAQQTPIAPEVPSAAATASQEPAPTVSVVAVVAGEGLEQIFRSLGATSLVRGGQTMNPSTQDLLEAIEACPSSEVVVLPNNKNIILAAEQAAHLSGKTVHVLPTRSVPQGIGAMFAYRSDAALAELEGDMRRGVEAVHSGEVTYAVRDTHFGNLEIHEGDVLGLVGSQVKLTGATPDEVLQGLLAQMVAAAGGEVITVYWGYGIDQERAAALGDALQEQYPDHTVEVRYGGQPLYYYIFSLE